MALGTTAAILLGLGAAGAGIGFSRALSSSSRAISPQPLPQPPSAAAAADKAGDIVRKKRATMTQSIYTSPLGIAGEAEVARKTLLGQ